MMAPKSPSPATQMDKIKRIFFKDTDITLAETQKIVTEGLQDVDYGEFFQEYTESEYISKSYGEFTHVSFGNTQNGFGFRTGQQANVAYAYSNNLNRENLTAAVTHARQNLIATSKVSRPQKMPLAPRLYPEADLESGISPQEKIEKINEIEACARAAGTDVENVSVSFMAVSRRLHIIRADGVNLYDSRPQSSLTISIMIKGDNGKYETASEIIGGPTNAQDVFDPATYKEAVDAAYNRAKTLLNADAAPSGPMEVVLNNGWPGVLLHEAVGHGLEGDFNRRSISVYSGKIGQKIASDKVTVVDQGDLEDMRGSLHFDDEGTPTQKNILIENGVLKKYMQDRQNAQLMGVEDTGNGRRQSYRHTPMPRMTNTYFAQGNDDPADIIKKVKYGLYVYKMGGGQVDITSGKFNMQAQLSYIIRDGKLCEPVREATLIGDGLDVIKNILDVGNDLKLERAAGSCGKNGQSLPAGIGQPTVRVASIKVGGNKI